MPSTYSPLKIELPATGEQSGTWGNTTNTNLGTALEEAITGSADVTFASGNIVLTLTDTNASQTARNLRLNLIGVTGGSTRTLTVPAIEKLYLVSNNCADAIIVGNATGATVTVPASTNVMVYNDGTDILNAITHFTGLSAGTINATTVDTTNLEVTNIKAIDGTASATIANSTGVMTVASSVLTTTDINGGTIDGVSIGTSSAVTDLRVDNIQIDGNSISSTNTNGNIVIAPNGTGDVQVDADTLRVGDSGVDAVIISNGNADLILRTGNATTGSVTLADGASGNLTVALNGTGQVVVNAGAVGTPTIAPTGDLNTGIYFPAADTIGFTEGGVEAMRIDSSANLLIGTTTNTNLSRLVANGTISETVSSVQYLVASQFDVGTAPNQIPLNQYLGSLAFQDSGNVIVGNINATGVATFSAGSVSAPAITTTGDTNTGVYFPAADTVSITTNGADRIYVNSSGNVGVGTSTPAVSGVEISRATGTATIVPAELRITTTSNANDWSTTSPWGKVSFYSEDGSGAGPREQAMIRTVAAATTGGSSHFDLLANGTASAPILAMRFSPAAVSETTTLFYSGNAVERARFPSTGEFLIGKTTVTTNGAVLQVSNGITFPATQVALSDANTLDDYEEGTWTPTISFGGASVGVTYASQSGTYTKIGRQVTLNFDVRLSSKGSSAGTWEIGNFPFSAGSEGNGGLQFQTGGATINTLAAIRITSGTLGALRYVSAGSSVGYANTDATDSSICIGQVIYFV
jgi:hypothetical protein